MSVSDLSQSGARPVLLGADDPAPCVVVNPQGRSRLVLICEHAGRRVPQGLGDLGLPQEAFSRHIAFDIGAEGVARALSARLDAALYAQPYSRLVVDCNRSLQAPDLIPEVADGTPVPGNAGLGDAQRAARFAAIHQGYHATVAAGLDARGARPTALVMVHSFTPRLETEGRDRPMHLGVLYHRDTRLGRALIPAVQAARPDLVVAENAPYRCSDLTDYAVPVHGEGRGLPHVLLEIRNDLIATPEGQADWAALLADTLTAALTAMDKDTAA